MICIEFSTENENSYLVDVVAKKIKQVIRKGVVQDKAEWWDYQELIGQGKIGEPLTIQWSENSQTTSSPVKALRFV